MKVLYDLPIGSFDLHLHTTASDGSLSPAQLVQKAAEVGLSTIAITDHDTLAGVEEAVTAGENLGVTVIPAVELSSRHHGMAVDVLGYELKRWRELHQWLHPFREYRTIRARKILKRLKQLGMPLQEEEVLAISGNGVIARPHIAKAMVSKGYIPNIQAAFDRYLGDGGPADVPKRELGVREAIDLIHKSGGIAVLAHPALLAEPALLKPLLGQGFDGIEVWHREHTPQEATHYLSLASERNLIVTGGSDFHREPHPLGRFIKLFI